MDDGFANVLTSVIFMFGDKCHMSDSTPLILESTKANRLSDCDSTGMALELTIVSAVTVKNRALVHS